MLTKEAVEKFMLDPVWQEILATIQQRKQLLSEELQRFKQITTGGTTVVKSHEAFLIDASKIEEWCFMEILPQLILRDIEENSKAKNGREASVMEMEMNDA